MKLFFSFFSFLICTCARCTVGLLTELLDIVSITPSNQGFVYNKVKVTSSLREVCLYHPIGFQCLTKKKTR